MNIVVKASELKLLDFSNEFLDISSEGYDIQTFSTLYQRTLDKVLVLSKEDMQNPEIINDLNDHLNNIAERSGLTPPEDITSDVLMDPEVSNEGLMDMFVGFVKKILEWLTNVVKWFANLFKTSNAASKIQETAAKNAAKNMEGKIHDIKKRTSAIQFVAPAKLAIIFHSRNHLPSPDYKYNESNMLKAIKAVKADMKVFYGKINEELVLLMDVADKALQRGMRGEPIQSQDMRKLFVTKPLNDLCHNGFSCMGFKLVTEPCRNDNEFRDVRYKIERREEGVLWNNSEQVTVSISMDQVKNINDEIVDAIQWHNKERAKILESVNDANLSKRFNKTKKLVEDALLKGTITDAQKAMALRYLNSAQDLASAAQLLAGTCDLFGKNYTALLSQYLVVLDKGLTDNQ